MNTSKPSNVSFESGRTVAVAEVETLEGYRSKDYNHDANVVLVEAKFMLKLGRNVFEGTFDQLRNSGDGSYTLIDFKTSKFQPDTMFLDVDYQLGPCPVAGSVQVSRGKIKKKQVPPEKLTITWYHLRDYLCYKRATSNIS